MRLFISQEEIVVCGTFVSGRAQCYVIRSIKPIVAEYYTPHIFCRQHLQAVNGHEIIIGK
jgi:hypothetical protein